MYWKETEIDFGIIKEGKNLTLTFFSHISIPEVMSITGTCGCTRVTYRSDRGTLEVVYKSGFVPNHLIEQEVRKMITVAYKDGTEEFLYIVGTKIR